MGICYTVPQSDVAVVEKFGRFQRLDHAGLHCLICCCGIGEQVAGYESLRLRQLDVRIQTKSKDNVFLSAMVSVQYQVMGDKIETAFYRLSNVEQQITAYVFDVVRASVPRINLDDVFEQKDDIAVAVKNELQNSMAEFGFSIIQVLVTDLDPDSGVKQAMNEINAARRLRDAAGDRAEAEKIIVVKAAEAEAESKFLAGVGIARQRKAIVEGLKESVVGFSEAIDGTTAKDVMDMILLTQYFDTIKEIGGSSKASTIFVPHTPAAVGGFASEIRNGFMQAGVINNQPR